MVGMATKRGISWKRGMWKRGTRNLLIITNYEFRSGAKQCTSSNNNNNNLYNKEKTCFFVRPSVRPSTFYIFHYFSKSIVANGKIIIEIGFNNYKKCK